MNKIKKLVLLSLVAGSTSGAFASMENTWTGVYGGVNASVIETTVSNANRNGYSFTNAAFGIETGANYGFDSGLILGMGVQANWSPFTNTSNNQAEGFYMTNQTTFFGAILGNAGFAVNQNFAILANAGIGYLKADTTGQTAANFSDHSYGFVMPVVGADIMYKADNGIYGKIGFNYYIPTTQNYHSTVANADAPLTKGLFQSSLTMGYYF